MKSLNIKKYLFGTSLAVASILTVLKADSIITEVKENEFIRELVQKYNEVFLKYPEERVYLQFDKSLYEPGEDVWFSATVLDARSLKPTNHSDILNIELIAPNGNVEKSYKLVLQKGKAAGDFRLDAGAPGGLYKIRAYTEWQKNDEDPLLFEKELTVQEVILPNLKMNLEFQRKNFAPGDEVIAKLKVATNENTALSNFQINYSVKINNEELINAPANTDNKGEMDITFNLPKKLKGSDGLLNVMINYRGQTESISRSIPIFQNKFSLSFYPEGGDLVNDLSSRVAFRALDEYNKPADIEGVIINSSGKEVAAFTSFHSGMGTFFLSPEDGETYTAKITKPAKVEQLFKLPEALSSGYVLTADNQNKSEINLTIRGNVREEISVIGQVRGNILYSNAVALNTGETKINIPASVFPAGVVQFTLFDSKGIERAERLVFVNRDKQLKVEIITDKERYLPREKVKMTITAKDEQGLPAPANLALSVTNDQLLSFANDKSGNILSKLLLEPDLKGNIEEPNFYFDQNEPKSEKALDHVMMTKGWRRFSWEQVLENDLPAITHFAEKATVAGSVKDAYTGSFIKNATVIIGKKSVSTDESGKYKLEHIDITESNKIRVFAQGYDSSVTLFQSYGERFDIFIYQKGQREFLKQNEVVQRVRRAPMDVPGRARMAEQIAFDEAPMANVRPEPRAVEEELMEKEVPAMPEEEDGEDKIINVRGIVAGNAMRRKQVNVVKPQEDNRVIYYRARTFSSAEYTQNSESFNRDDFRSTVYWNPSVTIDKNGKKVIEFYNTDEITSFRAIAEGFGKNGKVGRVEKTFFIQKPFSMNVKLPVEVVTEDVVSVPLTLVNNSSSDLSGALKVLTPEGFEAASIIPMKAFVKAGQAKTIHLDYRITPAAKEGDFTVSFNGNDATDSFSKRIKITSKGFPMMVSFSANEFEKEYEVNIKDLVKGSIKGSLTAYPSVISDLMKGVEAILREPSGCFEQTSMSSYPNVMVLDYLKATDCKDEKLLASANNLLDKGYKRLTSFETKEKGYEWFGAMPAHEALTAYGLMQFNDMKSVYKGVDQKMIDRTADWIISRRDGNGGFKRNALALDNFGSASEEITNAYIVYALTEAGYKDIKKEAEKVYDKALSSNDPYQLALTAITMFNLGENKKAVKALEELYKTQGKDGSFVGKTHSITRSEGNSLKIETTSLAILAMLKSQSLLFDPLKKSIECLVSLRSGHGSFGSTQGTILALKALTAYAKFSKMTNEDGVIALYVNGKRVAEKAFRAGEKDAIEIKNLEKYLSSGKNKIKVKYEGTKSSLPYSLGIQWNTILPESSIQCSLDLNVTLASTTAKVGETLRLTANIKNKKDEGLASPMVVIGIPAGFTFQPWQLKELNEKRMFDYYEINGNNLVLYYRQFAPSESKIINLDLKAEIPGVYEAPASCSYLYYTNEYKNWKGLDKVIIKI